MKTEPIKKLLRKYKGNLLRAPCDELTAAFKIANGNLEELIRKAESEYKKEQEKSE